MENFIRILVYLHAALGGIALLSGLIALVVKKGSNIHRKVGLVFFYAMSLSAIVAMVVSVSPNHINLFLTGIGIITLYSLMKGKRALLLKTKNTDFRVEKLVIGLLFLAGVGLFTYSYLHGWNVVSLVFSGTSLFFSIRDYFTLSKPEELHKNWLKIHLGNMIGGYISAVTAFVVVNELFPGIWGWFAPSLLGVPVIFYWLKRVS